MFIHEPRYMWVEDVTASLADQAAEALRVQEERIANYYVQNIENLSKDEAFQLMRGEVTLSAEKMLEYGIVSEIKETFNIAAIKQKSSNNMFGKKKTLQSIALKQGDNEVQAVYRGELAENVELEAFGTDEALNGEFVTNEHKLTIENNKVKSIEAIVTDEPEAEAVSMEVFNSLLEKVEAMSETLQALKGEKSNHKPAKTTVSNQVSEVSPQLEAKKKSKERQAENLKKRIENLKK